MKMILNWDEFVNRCKACKNCILAETRNSVVVERGSRTAPLMLIGEGPGRQEDEQGKPFVGEAGQLLDNLLSALMFKAEDYYICNIVKCRPPSNRTPTDNEAEACLGWLRNQVKLVRPLIMVCLGTTAARHIIGKDSRVTKIRGQWIERKGFWIMPTFHPAALLRDPLKKALLFEDMKSVKMKLDQLRET